MSETSPETVPDPDMFGGIEAAPEADIEAFANEKHMGRLRKYEEIGIYGDLPVREVVRFRYVNERHIDGMSQDMRDEYEFWYFTKPNKAKDKEDYAKHVRAWKRREKWLAGLEASRSPRHTPITDLSQERLRRQR